MYIMESEPDTKTIINKKMVDYFSGCSYYGFQVHPEVVRAACDAVNRYGISSATTSAVYGNNPVLLDLEKNAVQFFESEAVLYYASGCFGGSILLEGLRNEYDVIFTDNESHYSVKKAASSVHQPVITFEHMQAEDLRQKIRQHLKPSQRPLIICDGIFPISGEISPLPEYKEVLEGIEDAVICVDDAHATGVIGKKGHGTFEYFGMEGEKLYSCGTSSKALGGHGGIIAGDVEFIKKLKEKSPLANTCSPVPNPAAAATAKAFDILHNNPGLRKQLWDNVIYAKNGLQNLGFAVDDSPVPIICLYTEAGKDKGIDFETLQLELFKKDIAVTYVPPGAYTSVPPNGAVRISLFAAHTRSQIDHLIEEIKHLI